jgi:hypothetical protein
MKQPQILTLNLDTEVVKTLKGKDYNIYEGSQGFQIKLNIPYNSYEDCILQHHFPSNVHEFDMVILDQTNDNTIDYKENDHKITANKTTKEHGIRCRHPQSLFDPRPLSLTIIGKKIGESLNKPFLLVAFCTREETVEYATIESGYDARKESYSNYGFLPYRHNHYNKHGMKTKVADGNHDLLTFLRKYNEKFSYDIIFHHPTIYKDNKPVQDPAFLPLVYNQDNEIVSYLQLRPTGAKILVLPRLEDKTTFLTEFIEEVAPTLVPAIFPDNIKNSWVTSERYHLPNQATLLSQKAALLKKQAEELVKVDDAIVQNTAAYSWLHDLLTTTDDELVTAVIKFLEWLGFKDPKDYDEINTSGIKEEDIQVETDNGLLILEVKGIGGTSKDSDCSQVGKIKARRIQQLKKFEVSGVYVVNHQRHIPPHERKNPPFTDHQMSDASYDQRGLMTTWQLFNLYFLIEKGILSKEQAREAFFTHGYIDFIPKSFVWLGIPDEYFKNNTVAIITLPEKITLTVGEEIFTTHYDNYQKVKIKSLQVSDQVVTSATGTEVGIQFEQAIGKNTTLYKIV